MVEKLVREPLGPWAVAVGVGVLGGRLLARPRQRGGQSQVFGANGFGVLVEGLTEQVPDDERSGKQRRFNVLGHATGDGAANRVLGDLPHGLRVGGGGHQYTCSSKRWPWTCCVRSSMRWYFCSVVWPSQVTALAGSWSTCANRSMSPVAMCQH